MAKVLFLVELTLGRCLVPPERRCQTDKHFRVMGQQPCATEHSVSFRKFRVLRGKWR